MGPRLNCCCSHFHHIDRDSQYACSPSHIPDYNGMSIPLSLSIFAVPCVEARHTMLALVLGFDVR